MPEAVVDLPDPMSPPPAAGGNADELLSQLAGAQIDRLLSEAENAAPSSPSPIEADPEPIATPIISPVPEPTAAVTAESAVHEPVATPLATPDASLDELASESPLLRALEMINQPLAASPAWVRDLLGTVAILTLVNALGVIVFVLFFRHH